MPNPTLSRNLQCVAVAVEGLGIPSRPSWIVPHQVRHAGVGSNDLIARHQAVDDTRSAHTIPPLLAGLANQSIHNVERRVDNPANICQHIGHPDEVMIVVTRTSVGAPGISPKRFLRHAVVPI